MKFETFKNYKKDNLFVKLSKTHQFFEFNFDKFNVCDVCDEVLDCCGDCIKLQYEDIKKLNEYKGLKDFLRKDEDKYEECIDIIGVYKECDKDIVIFLAKNKIKNLAKKYNVSFENLYNFVKIHELAHGFMSPFVNNYKKTSYYNIEDIVIEESLATAFALKVIKRSRQFLKIQKFVENQPIQYKFGLKVFEIFENSIELLMILWKMSKITGNKKTIYQILLNLEWDNYVECKKFTEMLYNEKDEKSVTFISLILKEVLENDIFKELKTKIKKEFETVLFLNREKFIWIGENCHKYQKCIKFFAENLVKMVKLIGKDFPKVKEYGRCDEETLVALFMPPPSVFESCCSKYKTKISKDDFKILVSSNSVIKDYIGSINNSSLDIFDI